MGQIINLTCEKCNKNIELTEGQGINDNDLDRVLLFFDEKTASGIRFALSSTPNAVWYFDKKIALCCRNGNIKAVPVITVNSDGKEIMKAAGCDCGGVHVFYDTDKILAGSAGPECPVCKNRMKARSAGLWD